MPLNEQRAVANVRERKRTQKLNQAYKQLQSIIPKEPSDKMSKIHTLKLALAYIDFLNDMLKESDGLASSVGDCTHWTISDSSSMSQPMTKSPYASSPCSSGCAHSSNTSEEDEHEYQHRSKRLKMETTSDNMASYLRNAFREYRSSKRKISRCPDSSLDYRASY